MKKVVLIIMFGSLLTIGVCLPGCLTKEGYLNSETGVIYTPDEFEKLPAEQQAALQNVSYKIIEPEISGKIETGIKLAEGSYEIVKPYIPEPYATGTAIALWVLTAAWQEWKKRKIILGSKITAKTVDALVRPKTDLWEEFKKAQTAASADTGAVMPDEL